ncbi:hypothetical protein BD780_003858 [Clostridium tetanomorphum]|nr:hypothetical protein [Clostridium tetanomorphum]NRS86633.1 hypothetical protein [Clostridium tetanomorphum]
MAVPIFLAYIDYCKSNNLKPNIRELRVWKKLYNNR